MGSPGVSTKTGVCSTAMIVPGGKLTVTVTTNLTKINARDLRPEWDRQASAHHQARRISGGRFLFAVLRPPQSKK
jgi:hypothetical protein